MGGRGRGRTACVGRYVELTGAGEQGGRRLVNGGRCRVLSRQRQHRGSIEGPERSQGEQVGSNVVRGAGSGAGWARFMCGQ